MKRCQFYSCLLDPSDNKQALPVPTLLRQGRGPRDNNYKYFKTARFWVNDYHYSSKATLSGLVSRSRFSPSVFNGNSESE